MRTLSLRVLAVPLVGWVALAPLVLAGDTSRVKLQALLQQKVRLLQVALASTQAQVEAGRASAAALYKPRLALFRAQLAVTTDAPERAKLHDKLIAAHEEYCRSVEAEFRDGRAPQIKVINAKLAVLQGRIDKEQDVARKPATGKARKAVPAGR